MIKIQYNEPLSIRINQGRFISIAGMTWSTECPDCGQTLAIESEDFWVTEQEISSNETFACEPCFRCPCDPDAEIFEDFELELGPITLVLKQNGKRFRQTAPNKPVKQRIKHAKTRAKKK